MISILNPTRKFYYAIATVVLLAVLWFPNFSSAQTSQSLSVTPPLFQLSAVREQSWQSSIKVINTNDYPLTVYVDPVNFAPVGEEGQGRFLPILEDETGGQTLAEWIVINQESITIQPEQSAEIQFTVSVPKDAAPGGHFAAILVGTKPPETDEAVALRTSQVVSSLFFVSIDGDVVEKGSIREFSIDRSFTETPEAEFVLRFENEGNVHIRPQGEIRIFNMWGKERGRIPINHESQFGNVLPDTIRKFEFSWKGEPSFTDIGRYKADVTLAFGSKSRQSVTSIATFWVIPVKLAVISLIVLVILIFLIRWAIKSYVRHMLRMAGIDPEERQRERQSGSVVMNKKIRLAEAVSDEVATDIVKERPALLKFVLNYRYFFVGIPSAMILMGLLFWFVSGALENERAFEATITHGEREIEINSESMRFTEGDTVAGSDEDDQGYLLNVVNISGETGVGAKAATALKDFGYVINSVEPDLERVEKRTIVVAPQDFAEVAGDLSELFDSALVSLVDSNRDGTSEPSITLFVGQDYK